MAGKRWSRKKSPKSPNGNERKLDGTKRVCESHQDSTDNDAQAYGIFASPARKTDKNLKKQSDSCKQSNQDKTNVWFNVAVKPHSVEEKRK